MGIETIALAATVAGTAVSTLGAIQQGQAQADAFKYQSAVAQNNQIIAQRAAEDARKRGELESNVQRQRSRQLQGRQRAALAGAGVTVDQDSSLDLLADTAALGELDALTIRSNAEREALGFETQGMNFQAEQELSSSAASNAKTAGMFKAGSSLLSGAGSVAEKWYAFNPPKKQP